MTGLSFDHKLMIAFLRVLNKMSMRQCSMPLVWAFYGAVYLFYGNDMVQAFLKGQEAIALADDNFGWPLHG